MKVFELKESKKKIVQIRLRVSKNIENDTQIVSIESDEKDSTMDFVNWLDLHLKQTFDEGRGLNELEKTKMGNDGPLWPFWNKRSMQELFVEELSRQDFLKVSIDSILTQ